MPSARRLLTITPASDAHSSGSEPNERLPMTLSAPCATSATGGKVQIEAQRVQAAADVLPGGIGRCGILLLAERTHIADGRHAHVRVAADAADGAALLVNAEEERNFCVGLRVFQQRDGLFAVFKVFREIHDAADRVLLQRFLCCLPPLRWRC